MNVTVIRMADIQQQWNMDCNVAQVRRIRWSEW